MLIHLEEQDDPNSHAVVKICVRCRDIIDPMHTMETKKYNNRNSHTHSELKLFIEKTRPSAYQFR